jgi:hypothetical protein
MSKTTLSSTSGSSSIEEREFLLFFGKSEGFWAHTLKGFSHCFIGETRADILIIFEPLFSGGSFELLELPIETDDCLTVLSIRVKSTHKNRLIKPTFQTCSTLVQYMAGINLGPITPQGLYEALTLSDAKWLKRRGVLEVKAWEK